MPGYGAAMTPRKLPAGIQTFREVREGGFYYVDKTAFAQRLVEDGKHYFLSRPRRFGKSLFLDTLKELFEASEPLFRGLAVHGHWDWGVRHPVIRLSFAAGSFNKPGRLEANFNDKLASLESAAGMVATRRTPEGRLTAIIETLHERSGQRVVLLVDEYDRPIADALGESDLAADNRDFLRGVYGVVKDCDAHIRFSFFTGVSKFSKSVFMRGACPSRSPAEGSFSDLNNLTDITLDGRFAAICGYTEADLDAVFAAELRGLDRTAVRDWYNGYSWRADGEEKVYNPYGMLLFLRSREFKPHWFETGTPAFLPRLLLERQVAPAALDNLVVGEADLAAFDIERIETAALLFQTGYLTIRGREGHAGDGLYRLGYPNREVRGALNASLLGELAPSLSAQSECSRLRQLLTDHDFAGVERLLRAFFASVPHQWFIKNDIARHEGFYASVFYAHFAGAGLDVIAEESTSRGRADMTVLHDGGVCVFEFKTGGDAEAALAQIKRRGYADKHQHSGQPIHLVGVAFSPQERSIAAFAVERL